MEEQGMGMEKRRKERKVWKIKFEKLKAAIQIPRALAPQLKLKYSLASGPDNLRFKIKYSLASGPDNLRFKKENRMDVNVTHSDPFWIKLGYPIRYSIIKFIHIFKFSCVFYKIRGMMRYKKHEVLELFSLSKLSI